MKNYFYDLHIHSCLSPCGDNDSTPANIAGICAVNGLDIAALTDHNTAKNCPAFFEAALNYGVLPLAGIELTTAEEIHMVCLFETLEKALAFDDYLQSRRMLIPNRVDIFGDQLICDAEDNVIAREENLLVVATDISFEEAPSLIESYGGICYPAHIDKASNSVSSVLGLFPETPKFTCAEIFDPFKIDELSKYSSIDKSKLIISSDAHYLADIKEKNEFFTLKDIPENSLEAGKYLIEFLREKL